MSTAPSSGRLGGYPNEFTMKYPVATLIALAFVSCSEPAADKSAGGDMKADRAFPTASCPHHKDVTWCLLFTDHADASITVTQVTPKARGIFIVGSREIPVQGTIADSKLTLELESNDRFNSPTIILEGSFPQPNTPAAARMFVKWADVKVPVTLYTPGTLPRAITYDASKSVTGVWAGLAATAPTTDLYQLGNFLLRFDGENFFGEKDSVMRAGLRTGSTFSFPNYGLIDGGDWIDGTFSTDLTAMTGVSCQDSIAKTFCRKFTWVRR